MSSDLQGTAPGKYRGRLAPSPTGLLHLGHARTFWTAYQRSRDQGGVLVFRNEDLDRGRCRPEFVQAMLEDLRWFGIQWEEGPDRGGPFGPYHQSERQNLYAAAFETLRERGLVYRCTCSRQDVQRALQAPHLGEDEPIYPGTCRMRSQAIQAELEQAKAAHSHSEPTRQVNWRFRVPDGESISFRDGKEGHCEFVAGRDFGDFIVWRYDQSPSYQLAVVVDDAAMAITEVVRGADLLRSTARQLLLYRALRLPAPQFFHCPLMTDEAGIRLAKRHDALSLRSLRQQGGSPEKLRATWE